MSHNAFSALKSVYPPGRIAIVLDQFSPQLSTKKDSRVNRIECRFTALRYFAQDGTATAPTSGYIAWQNRPADNEELRTIFNPRKRCLTRD